MTKILDSIGIRQAFKNSSGLIVQHLDFHLLWEDLQLKEPVLLGSAERHFNYCFLILSFVVSHAVISLLSAVYYIPL